MGVFDNLFKIGKKEEKAKANFIDDEWIEVTAGSRDEAIDRASSALNATEKHLEIQWLTKDGKKLRARKKVEGAEVVAKPKRAPRKKPTEKKPEPVEFKNDDIEESSYVQEFEEEVEEETEHGRKAKELLIQIVQFIDKPSTVELYETNKTIRLEIESSESGLFIGKYGQTLEALQHLMMKMIMDDDNKKFLVIDAEDYRTRREESLEAKAQKLAKKARKENRPVGVEPMNALDRRIVHMALKGEPGIETKSIGEGSSRRVLIVPKGYQRSGNNNSSQRRGRYQSRDQQPSIRRDKGYEGPSRSDDVYDDDY